MKSNWNFLPAGVCDPASPQAAVPAVCQPKGSPRLPKHCWFAELPQPTGGFSSEQGTAKARLGREAAYGFCQHLEECGAGASGAVSECVSTDLPLAVLVLVLSSACENLSPVCNTEWSEAELRLLQPHPTQHVNPPCFGNIRHIAGLLGHFQCWALQEGQWPQPVPHQSWAGRGNWWTEQ